MLPKPVNADKPHLWKADVAASVDRFNQWFMRFAPQAFRSTRVKTVKDVTAALLATRDLRALDVATLRANPGSLPTLRMCTAPPLAVDRLVGLAGASKVLIGRMEEGKLANRMPSDVVDKNLRSVCQVLSRLLDRDIFPWLDGGGAPTDHERERAATVVADRLCSAVTNPIIRNAQEQRQLGLIARWLEERGYKQQRPPAGKPISEMQPGSYSFRFNLPVNRPKVNVPIDVVVQPKKLSKNRLPVLIEAKSAGDFTNTNKRRKEEATKAQQLRATYGKTIRLVLFLCGYFGSDYLGYEAAERIDWVWEHRIDDFKRLGLWNKRLL
jgi:type II restriction enzyme